MITSDGRSAIEVEVEQMQFAGLGIGEHRMKVDCRDHSLPDASDTTEYNYPPDQRPSRLTRWFENLISKKHTP
jgi:hypothetical protein